MNIRRMQGLALMLGAAGFVIAFASSGNPLVPYANILSALLFIFGIPAINAMQPSGILGLLGIGLMILAAVIAIGFNVGLLGDTPLAEVFFVTSALSGLVGRILTGWLTVKRHVFSPWLGWLLIAEGVLNAAGFLDFGTFSTLFGVGVTLLSAVVQFGYGLQIFQKSAAQPLPQNHS